MAEQTLYRFFDKENNLLYIGISINAYNRYKGHLATKTWMDGVANITLQGYNSRAEVEAAEIEAIRSENPKYNRIRYNKNERPSLEELIDNMAQGMANLTADEIATAMKGAFEGYAQLKALGKNNG